MNEVEVTYFSDVLCIWAYASQARVDAVKEQFGDSVQIKHRFCSVFGQADPFAGKVRCGAVGGHDRPHAVPGGAAAVIAGTGGGAGCGAGASWQHCRAGPLGPTPSDRRRVDRGA